MRGLGNGLPESFHRDGHWRMKNLEKKIVNQGSDGPAPDLDTQVMMRGITRDFAGKLLSYILTLKADDTAVDNDKFHEFARQIWMISEKQNVELKKYFQNSAKLKSTLFYILLVVLNRTNADEVREAFQLWFDKDVPSDI